MDYSRMASPEPSQPSDKRANTNYSARTALQTRILEIQANMDMDKMSNTIHSTGLYSHNFQTISSFKSSSQPGFLTQASSQPKTTIQDRISKENAVIEVKKENSADCTNRLSKIYWKPLGNMSNYQWWRMVPFSSPFDRGFHRRSLMRHGEAVGRQCILPYRRPISRTSQCIF